MINLFHKKVPSEQTGSRDPLAELHSEQKRKAEERFYSIQHDASVFYDYLVQEDEQASEDTMRRYFQKAWLAARVKQEMMDAREADFQREMLL